MEDGYIIKGVSLRAYPTPEQEAKLLAWSEVCTFFYNDLVGWWRRGIGISGRRKSTITLADGMVVSNVKAVYRAPNGDVVSDVPLGPVEKLTAKNAAALSELYEKYGRQPIDQLRQKHQQQRSNWTMFAGAKSAPKPFYGNSNAVATFQRPEGLEDLPAVMLHGAGQDFDQAITLWHTKQHKDAPGLSQWRNKRIKRGKTPLPKKFYGALQFSRRNRNSLRWQNKSDRCVTRINKRRGLLMAPKLGRNDDGKVVPGFIEVSLDSGWDHNNIIKSVRLFKDDLGNWWVGLSVEAPVKNYPKPKFKSVGLDRGVTIPVAVSAGSGLDRIPGLTLNQQRRLKLLERRVAKIHRMVSPECHEPGKRCSGECDWVKNPSERLKRHRYSIAKLKALEVNRREHVRQNFTARVVKRSQKIFAEELNIKAMTGSASGTTEAPGKSVAAKSGLNRSILAVGWGELDRQLAYKSEWAGRTYAKVPAPHTSQRCSQCGFVDAKNRRSQSRFVCTNCGHEDNADHNAALNIENLGLKELVE